MTKKIIKKLLKFKCYACSGTGEVDKKKCKTCKGSGVYKTSFYYFIDPKTKICVSSDTLK